jgi:non-ribosomal peptide synthetase component F/aryl carrier-like protein
MLAVLRAGGTCLCIEPDLPRERVRVMIKKTAAKLILCSPSNVNFVHYNNTTIIPISPGTFESISKQSTSFDPPIVRPHDSAFVIFTSGSTGKLHVMIQQTRRRRRLNLAIGKPKAILLEHVNLSTNLQLQNSAINLPCDSRVLHFVSYAFDISIWEVFGTLIRGGRLYIPSSFDRMNNLSGFIQQHDINLAFFTPSMLRLLQPEGVPQLRTIVVGGEAVTQQLVDTWASKVVLVNGYGPAEVSLFSSLGRIPERGWKQGTIGHFVGRGWVTTPNDPFKLAAIGAVGELLMEGPGVARGYLNSPEQTASSFIDGPPWLQKFLPKKGSKLYRTGDLMQYNKNGTIRWVGRQDNQIKLRGQRIELGEVEFRVQQCFQHLREVLCEMVVPTEEDRAPFLAGFLLFEQNSDHKTQTAREQCDTLFLPPTELFFSKRSDAELQLHRLLPAVMVPTIFIPVSHMPLSKTQKTDRRRLRDLVRMMSRAELDAYSTITREKKYTPSIKPEIDLQLLWAHVLKIQPDTIGAKDSFFRLGGDSISAMKLSAMASSSGMEVTVADIFKHPELSEMSSVLRYMRNSGSQTIPPFSLIDDMVREDVIRTAMDQCQVEKYQVEDAYPCTALQEGLVALTAKNSDAYVANLVYKLPSNVDLSRLRSAWEAAAQANLILRTRIIQTESVGAVQCVIRGQVDWQLYDDRAAYDANLQSRSMELGKPLLRLSFIKNANTVIITIHHSIYDGFSLPLVLRQVEDLYYGRKTSLQPRPFSPFIAYISQSIPAAEEFWRSELSNVTAPIFPASPSGYTAVPNTPLAFTIPEFSERKDDFTTSIKLRLAWAIVQSVYAGSNDVLFGTVVNGRGVPVRGIEHITGPTIATIPVRLQLRPEETIAKALENTQTRAISMMPYEQLGLQNISKLGTDAAAACQFQSLFAVEQRKNQDQSSPEQGSSSNSTESLRHLFQACEESSNQEAFTTYALTVLCQPSTGCLEARFDAKLISEEEVFRFLNQFSHVLCQINKDREILIKDIPLSPSHRSQLEIWNKNTPQRFDLLVHDLIHEICLSYPDKPAVCAWDGGFTYKQLDELSSRLANHLTNSGIGVEIVVPLLFEKSRWTTVAILGVLKAGAGFLLLDAQHPLNRLQGMCRAVDAKLILSSSQQAASAAKLISNVVVVREKEEYFENPENYVAVGPTVLPTNTLYV